MLREKLHRQDRQLTRLQGDYLRLSSRMEAVRQGGLGRLTMALGKLEVRQEGDKEWRKTHVGLVITPQTTLRTTSGAKGEIHLAGRGLLRINESTEVAFSSEREIALKSGEAWLHYQRSEVDTSEYSIATRDGLIALTGTEVNIEVDSQFTTLAVLQGSAHMKNQQGKKAEVKAGQACRMNPNKLHRPYYLGTLERGTRWMLELVRSRGDYDSNTKEQVNRWLSMLGEAKAHYLAEAKIKSYGQACVIPLVKYMETPSCANNPATRKKTIKILRDVGDWYAVDTFINLLKDPDPQIRTWAAQGLHRVTGQTMGYSEGFWRGVGDKKAALKHWEDWWKANQKGKISRDLDVILKRVQKKFDAIKKE